MNSINSLLEELTRLHGRKLDFEKHHYFLFLEDGVFDIYYCHDDKEMKVEVTLTDNTKVYYSDKRIIDLMLEEE